MLNFVLRENLAYFDLIIIAKVTISLIMNDCLFARED